MSGSAPIGVFDSGIGGLSVLRALRTALPHEDFVYYADSGHAPYGERGDAHVLARSREVLALLVRDHRAKAVVVACNTATAAAIDRLRAELPALPMVGVEPALKPAAAVTRTGVVGVIGTRGTLASARVRALHDALAPQARFVLQPCDGLADAIEQHDSARVDALCAQYLAAMGPFGTGPGQIDTLVLGCTHYPFARERLQALAGSGVTLMDTGEPVARQTARLLDTAGLRAPASQAGSLRLRGSGDATALAAAAQRWL